MHFYTYVGRKGNNIFERGYKDGKPYKNTIKYKPYLFVKSDKTSPFKTIKGEFVSRLEFDSISDAREYIYKYKDVKNHVVYGLTDYEFTYIHDNFPKAFDFDFSLLNVVNTDIETDSSQGFPDIDTANREINAITLAKKGKTLTLGLKKFVSDSENKIYIECKDEETLLKLFIHYWNTKEWLPDIVSGWNCVPKSQYIWGTNHIDTIENITYNLFDSNIKHKSPISKKQKCQITLCNGQNLFSSKDHKFPVIKCNKENYTKLNLKGKKNTSEKVLMTLEEISLSTDNVFFLEVPKRKNNNPDNPNYTLEELYLAGLIYTDGSLKNKNNPSHGYTFYQSDIDFINKIKSSYDCGVICGNQEKGFSLYVKYDSLKASHSLIYNVNLMKRLNIKELSTLSYKQFMYFLSGFLDGDGCISSDGKIGLCDYNNEIQNIHMLLLWNNIFSTISGNTIRFNDNSIEGLVLKKSKRWDKIIHTVKLKRSSSQKAKKIKFKELEDNYLVRIKDISFLDEECDMMDIETDTHLFITNGVRVHNCEFFDIPYIINRIKRILGDEWADKLSPFKHLQERIVRQRNGKEVKTYLISGIAIIDYFAAYKKFAMNERESYKLDYIAEFELGEKKVDYSEYKSLNNLYIKNPQLYIEYNIHDAVLIEKLENKLHYIEQIVNIAYIERVNFENTLSTVKPWDITTHNWLMDNRKQVVPFFEADETNTYRIVGGFVKDPKPGLYKNVVSVDFTSLYPSLAMQYNISPDTFTKKVKPPDLEMLLRGDMTRWTEELKKRDLTLTANGGLFKRDQRGFIPSIMKEFFDERKRVRKLEAVAEAKYEETKSDEDRNIFLKYNNLQTAFKLINNSGFGAIANKYFRWFDNTLAEGITLSGQMTIQYVEYKVNVYLNEMFGTQDVDYVVYCDTDSAYITLEKLINREGITDKFDAARRVVEFSEKELCPFIDSICLELANRMNAYEFKTSMKLEKVCDQCFFTSKKHYALNVIYSEGIYYKEPKLKVKGLETVRSSIPKLSRNALERSYKIIFTGDRQALIDHTEKFRQDFFKMDFAQIGKPSGVNNIAEYYDPNTLYKKACPIHVRGSIVYNHFLKKNKLTDKYQLIEDYDKIKYCYLKMPNPSHSNVIAIKDDAPEELDINSHLDYKTQFDKIFMNPLQAVCDAVEWETSKIYTLEDMF